MPKSARQRRRSWWLECLVAPETRAEEFVKAHAVKVADVMTKHVVTATEETSLRDLATILEKNGIKRLPIMRGEKVVGIVSRRNILQAFAQTAAGREKVTATDTAIRDAIMEQIRRLPWGEPWLVSVSVTDGVVELWGPVNSEEEQQALRVAAEATPGVKAVKVNFHRIRYSAAA